MIAEEVLNRLFPQGHDVAIDGDFLFGAARVSDTEVAFIGTRDSALVGVDLALRMAGEVINIIETRPGCPILLLTDTAGQKLSRRDEMLGLNGYVAQLAKCLDVARRRGHRIIGLVYGEAVSAGFLSSSLLADACYALPEAQMGVMNLPAMARVTKIPVERLEHLSRTSPVFAPGVENYVAMGAVQGLWQGDLAAALAAVLSTALPGNDRRRADGEMRGGRKLARSIAARIRHAP